MEELMRGSMHSSTTAVGLAWLLALAGCAGTDVAHYAIETESEANSEAADEGLRYYQEAPFLLVYSEQGDYSSQLLYLPDTSTIHSVTPWDFIASNELQLELENGVLVGANTKVDATKVPKAILSALKDVAVAAARMSGGAAAANQGDQAQPRIYLYKVVVDAAGTFSLLAAEPVEYTLKEAK